MTQLTDRERRWLDALLIIGTLLAAVLLVGQLSNWLLFFSDILLIFFLAWLLAFVINPLASAMVHTIPGLPRAGAVILTYALLLVVLTAVALFAAGSLATSTQAFLASVPQLQQNLPAIVKPWQDWLASIGLQADLAAAAQQVLTSLGSLGTSLVGPLTNLAVASLGLFGNLIIVIFLSLYLAIDGEQTMAFVNRLVPPRYAEDFALLEVSVSRSFGGFLRGPGAPRPGVRPDRGGHELAARPGLRPVDVGQLGHPAGHPVLRPVHLVGPAGRGRPAHQAGRRPARAGAHDRRLVRGHEHPPAARHG